VRDGEARFVPLLSAWLRAKRRGQGGTQWHADEPYSKGNGRWCHRYRALDRDGHLVAALLSAQRAMAAAPQFCAQARDMVGHAPAQVPTEGHQASPRAIRETLGPGVRQRTGRYNNKRIEQDHRGIKHRYDPMRGCGSFTSAARCCTGCAEQRQYFRPQVRSDERVSLAARRRRFPERYAAVMAALAAA